MHTLFELMLLALSRFTGVAAMCGAASATSCIRPAAHARSSSNYNESKVTKLKSHRDKSVATANMSWGAPLGKTSCRVDGSTDLMAALIVRGLPLGRFGDGAGAGF